MSPLAFSLLSGAIGAFIGTFLGAALLSFLQNRKQQKIRKMAIKAIGIFSKYAKKGGTFDQATSEFNNSLSLAEKRTVLVALHKLGVPIASRPDVGFSLEEVLFEKETIDKDELSAISGQIKKGLCDHLFYLDPDTYFKEDMRIKTLRALAVRWVEEVLSKSTFTYNDLTVHYPLDWIKEFSWGEKWALGVFKQRVSVNEYFDEKGDALPAKMDKLVKEIDLGLWDGCLFWDFENYQSMKSTNDLNATISSLISANNSLPRVNG